MKLADFLRHCKALRADPLARSAPVPSPTPRPEVAALVAAAQALLARWRVERTYPRAPYPLGLTYDLGVLERAVQALKEKP